MEEDKLSSERLFVLRPSKVVYYKKESEYYENLSNLNATFPTTKEEVKACAKEGVYLVKTNTLQNIKHQIYRARDKRYEKFNTDIVNYAVKYLQKPSDVTIGYYLPFCYTDLFSDKTIFANNFTKLDEFDYCVGVYKNDRILLAKYLLLKFAKHIKYNDELEEYILSQKPFYTMEELNVIYEKLKWEMALKEKENPKIFTLKKQIQMPIYIKR